MPYSHGCSIVSFPVCSSFFLVMLIAGSISTDVNSAVISKDMMYSPPFKFLACSIKSLDVVGELQLHSFDILASSLATPCVTEPLLETMGLGGIIFLWIFGSQQHLGKPAPMGYILL